MTEEEERGAGGATTMKRKRSDDNTEGAPGKSRYQLPGAATTPTATTATPATGTNSVPPPFALKFLIPNDDAGRIVGKGGL